MREHEPCALEEPGAHATAADAAGDVPRACVECEMTFPSDYPFSPPSVRVVRPRFRKSTGYIIGGALCMELLTPQGWNVTFSIEAILEQMRIDEQQHANSALAAGGVRFPAPIKFGMTLLSKVMTKSTYRV